MNIHVIQSPMAMMEVKHLMAVRKQIISPQASKPVMAIVQDSLLGAYLMTFEATFLRKDEFAELLSWIRYPVKPLCIPLPCVTHPVPLWTCHQLFSLLLPSTMNLIRYSSDSDDVPDILILNGDFVMGTLNKQYLGTSAGGIVDAMYRDFGTSATVEFITNHQRIVCFWLLDRGFSVGIQDCVLCDTGEEEVMDILTRAIRNIDCVSKEVNDSSMLIQAESARVQMLAKILMQTASIVSERAHISNAVKDMIGAGSKGNPVNLCQISGCVGQQSVEGARITAEKGLRTLSCFPHSDDTVNSRGMVQNSYTLGIRADEFFFHAMGGREGLVDTAVKTATTGYIQRRQVKAMEDAKVHYDGTVRMGSVSILDFTYGGDNLDPTKLERQKLRCLLWNRDRIRAEMGCQMESACGATEEDAVDLEHLVRTIRDHRYSPFEVPDVTTLFPFNTDRLRKFYVRRGTERCVTYEEARREMLACANKCEVNVSLSLLCFRACLLEFFSSHKMVTSGIGLSALRSMFFDICDRFVSAMAQPGEAVGSIAAQSVGEVSASYAPSQHSRNVMSDLPRLRGSRVRK
jgi:DNA-directed RNA polymerase II subunit RPB1